MAPQYIRDKGHPTEIRYYQQEIPDEAQEWLEGKPIIGPIIFDFEAWKCHPNNVISNLDLAPT